MEMLDGFGRGLFGEFVFRLRVGGGVLMEG